MDPLLSIRAVLLDSTGGYKTKAPTTDMWTQEKKLNGIVGRDLRN